MSRSSGNLGIHRLFPVFMLGAFVFIVIMFAPLIFVEQEKVGTANNMSTDQYSTEYEGILGGVVAGVEFIGSVGLVLIGILAIIVSFAILRVVGWI